MTPYKDLTVSITGDLPPAALFADDPHLGQFHGDVCPAGHYCPKGSTKPSPCPPGKKKKKT